MKRHIKNLTTAGVIAAPVTAMADGFTKAGTLLDKVSTGLLALSIVTVTIAVLWVGYKVLFDGKSLHDMRNVIIGAILIVGASGFGAYWAS